MPPSQPSQVDVQFPGGERYAYGVVPFRRLEIEIPQKPGLYSWHFRLPKSEPEVVKGFLQRLFVSSTIEVSAKSNLRQAWHGKIHSTVEPFQDLGNAAFRDFFFALAYPLYIGISQNLSKRLATHKRELNKWRVDGGELGLSPIEDDAVDTDAESRSFGQRLGAIFRDSGFTETDCLYVKFYTPKHCGHATHCGASVDCLKTTMSELRSAEWACNSLFHPALGRR